MVAVRERHKPLCYSCFMFWKDVTYHHVYQDGL